MKAKVHAVTINGDTRLVMAQTKAGVQNLRGDAVTFDELMDNHAVTAIRKTTWAIPTDRLELPPVIDGARGPWCKLVAFDGMSVTATPLLAMQCRDAANNWEEWKGPEVVECGGCAPPVAAL